MIRLIALLLLIGLGPWARAAEEPATRVLYIANMGAMVEHGETKIVFDPLFSNHYDTYEPVPAEVEAALLAGNPPWDGIDAVFISHHHGDHFDPPMILELLRSQPAIVSDRVHGLSLENGMTSTDIALGPVLVEAVRIRHAGWPDRHANIENIVFRVTLDSDTTVMHFGDADPADAHFAISPEHWKERHAHLAMPPYWFFLSSEGRQILDNRIGADKVIGMHVPTKIPDDPENRPENLQSADLFVKPGEQRTLVVE